MICSTNIIYIVISRGLKPHLPTTKIWEPLLFSVFYIIFISEIWYFYFLFFTVKKLKEEITGKEMKKEENATFGELDDGILKCDCHLIKQYSSGSIVSQRRMLHTLNIAVLITFKQLCLDSI